LGTAAVVTTESKLKKKNRKKKRKKEAYAAGQCNWSTSEGRGTSHRRNKKYPSGVHPQVKKIK
jgi:surface antigen